MCGMKCGGNSAVLCPGSFGAALGLVFGITKMFVVWFVWIMPDKTYLSTMIHTMYPGFEPSLMGGLVAGFCGFLTGFVMGFFIALFYDWIRCYCKARCCKSVCASGDKVCCDEDKIEKK